ncbi:4'-phosphopantetheinyl transferase family protein [Paenibacillus sp. FSL R7-277]|uniref:4'-phosphopantetheinyl transferase family protein n=1 Tax=unclassified Paenibacillus TaxID=185978 RepID=UPI0009DE2A90
MLKDEKEKIQYFYDLWTLKESYIKAYGQGLTIPLNLVSFSVNGNDILFENRHSPERYYFRQYQVHPQYKLAVCSLSEDFPPKFIIWGLDQLLDAVRQLEDSSGEHV